jgi:tetratricopeptide (TPR) repeat protein
MRFSLAFLAFAVSCAVYGQKRCDCALKNEFVEERDFRSDTVYKKANPLTVVYRLRKEGSPACKAFAHDLMAAQELSKANYENAYVYLRREKHILDSLRCRPANYLEYYVGSADLYVRLGELEKAIPLYNTALTLLNRNDNPAQRSRILLSLSNAHSKISKEELARAYMLQAHPVVTRLADGTTKTNALYNLSQRYYHQFQVTGRRSYLDSANNMAHFGFRLARKSGNTEGFIRGYNLLEDKEYHEQNYRKALVYLDSALYFTVPSVHLAERNGIYADMADIYLQLKQYDKAYKFADSSLFYARLMANPFRERDAMELLYNCSKLSGEYERALSVYQDLESMRDSIRRIEIRSSSAYRDLEERYHRVSQQKSQVEHDQDMKLFEQQREIDSMGDKLLVVGLVITALLGCYILIVFRQKKIHSRQKRLEVENRLQRARINPEFLYKALENLQHGKDTESKKLAVFSKLVKQTLEGANDDFLTLDKEKEFLTYYLELQKDRFPHGLGYSFVTDPSIDAKDVCVPAMILQPFLENSVERGFSGIDRPAHIDVSFTLKNNELNIRLADNGKGLKAGTSSRATELLNDRIYMLNRMNKDSASYFVRERQSGGVEVEIFLPLITCAMAEQRKKDL